MSTKERESVLHTRYELRDGGFWPEPLQGAKSLGTNGTHRHFSEPLVNLPVEFANFKIFLTVVNVDLVKQVVKDKLERFS